MKFKINLLVYWVHFLITSESEKIKKDSVSIELLIAQSLNASRFLSARNKLDPSL